MSPNMNYEAFINHKKNDEIRINIVNCDCLASHVSLVVIPETRATLLETGEYKGSSHQRVAASHCSSLWIKV